MVLDSLLSLLLLSLLLLLLLLFHDHLDIVFIKMRKTIPAGIYMLKVTIETLEQGVKYVQS